MTGVLGGMLWIGCIVVLAFATGWRSGAYHERGRWVRTYSDDKAKRGRCGLPLCLGHAGRDEAGK